MMKLAVIFESSPFDRKGLFNAVHNRVKHLLATGECSVDVFCVHSRDNAFTRRVRHTPEVPSVDETVVDGIRYRLLWYRFSILDNVLLEKLHVRPCLFRRFMESHVDLLKGYDAVIAHSFCGGLFALAAHERFGVPYYVTWHGSDVHTHPWRVPVILEDTRAVMKSARCNFFVSRALLDASERIISANDVLPVSSGDTGVAPAHRRVTSGVSPVRKEVLYNGVSEDFVKYSPERRAAVRERYGLAPEDKVVAFVGNIVTVKNVLSLPEIFAQVASRFAEVAGTLSDSCGRSARLKFWIVGDGKLKAQLETACSESLTRHCEDQSPSRHCEERSDVAIRFFGNQPSPAMPDIMNCIDVLVLPSLNEGLPLVCAEALSCGAAVVGSDVGGIAEVIGSENVVPLVSPYDNWSPSDNVPPPGPHSEGLSRPYDDSFVNGMAEKVVAALMGQTPSQALPADISWPLTATLELAALKSL
ncbi:MAG: glycosyltransferase [Bacteroidales bacterium]|nr:glycosyltransferase [Bacteroidales bacterium]